MLKRIILLLFVSTLISCETINPPVVHGDEWENITYNLTGEKIITFKIHRTDLYASTYHAIYSLHDKNWKEIATIAADSFLDFEFRNDTLFILTDLGKIYYLGSNDSLMERYDLKLPGTLVMLVSGQSFYIGKETPYYYGLTKISDTENFDYPMNNFHTSYDVSQIIQHKNIIYIGTINTSGYFVGKLENDILTAIGLNANNGYSIGECYSMAFAGDTLLVGSGGEVLSYVNNYWSLYKDKIPTIESTILKDKALALLEYNGQTLVGTKHNGIIKYNAVKGIWEKYFNTGLPAKYSINYLKKNNNYIYSILGYFNFTGAKRESQFIYRLDTSKLNFK